MKRTKQWSIYKLKMTNKIMQEIRWQKTYSMQKKKLCFRDLAQHEFINYFIEILF